MKASGASVNIGPIDDLVWTERSRAVWTHATRRVWCPALRESAFEERRSGEPEPCCFDALPDAPESLAEGWARRMSCGNRGGMSGRAIDRWRGPPKRLGVDHPIGDFARTFPIVRISRRIEVRALSRGPGQCVGLWDVLWLEIHGGCTIPEATGQRWMVREP